MTTTKIVASLTTLMQLSQHSPAVRTKLFQTFVGVCVIIDTALCSDLRIRYAPQARRHRPRNSSSVAKPLRRDWILDNVTTIKLATNKRRTILHQGHPTPFNGNLPTCGPPAFHQKKTLQTTQHCHQTPTHFATNLTAALSSVVLDLFVCHTLPRWTMAFFMVCACKFKFHPDTLCSAPEIRPR